MLKINNKARDVILEMISCYHINDRANSKVCTNRKLIKSLNWLSSVLILVSLTMYFSFFSNIASSMLGFFLTLQIGVLAVLSFIFFVVNGSFWNLVSYAGYHSLNIVVTSYYKLRRYFKIKNSKNLERELMESYHEIKDWCLENNRTRDLEVLVRGLKFPSESTYHNFGRLLDYLNTTNIVDNTLSHKDFISLDDLEKIVQESAINTEENSIKEAKEFKFFEKCGESS